MSSHLSLLFVWTTLLLSIACKYTAHCSVLNTTEISVTVSSDRDMQELGHEYEGEDENHEEDISIIGSIIDDSILVQPVIKPEKPTEKKTKKGEKKNANKKKADRQKKKKNDPCQATHKNFCIHGKCRYLADVGEVSCICHQEYFGVRCSERSLKAEATDKQNDMATTTVLAVVAVLLSTISIVAIIIIIVVHTRRKYSSYDCEAEEKTKLGQENGSEEVDV